MTTNYHTPHALSAPLTSTGINAPLAELDAAITDLSSAAFNVKMYGAVGDGVTDDKLAIQAALNAASSIGGGTVVFPPGVYYVSAPVTVYAGTSLVGAGPAGQQFVDDGTQGSVLLSAADSGIITTDGTDIVGGNPAVSGRKEFYSFRGLRFKNADAASAGTNILVDIRYAYNIVFEDCIFDGTSRGGTLGLRLYNSGHVAVRKCYFYDFPAHTTASYTRPGLEICPTPSSFTGGFPVQMFHLEDLIFGYCDRAIDIGNRASPTNDGIHTVTIKGVFSKKSGMAGESLITLATSAASDDIIDTVSPHGLSAGDAIHFATLTGGAGLSLRTTYYVSATSLGASTFRVATTNGGAAIGFTSDITAGVAVKQTDTTATDVSTGIACASVVDTLSISDCKFEDISAPLVIRAYNAKISNVYAQHAGTMVDVLDSKYVDIDGLSISSEPSNVISAGVHFDSSNLGPVALRSFRVIGTSASSCTALVNEAGLLGAPIGLVPMGGSNVGGSSAIGAANRMVFVPCELRQAAVIDTIQVFCNTVAGSANFKVAIYDIGGNLLANSAATANDTTTGRRTISLTSSVALAPGLYYLALVSDSNTPTFGVAGGSGTLGVGDARYQESAYTTLPNPATFAGSTSTVPALLGNSTASWL